MECDEVNLYLYKLCIIACEAFNQFLARGVAKRPNNM